MRRRQVLRSLVGGSILLSGCTEDTEREISAEPVTMTDGRYPRYQNSIELTGDEDYWVLKLPRHDREKAIYRYDIENTTPENGEFDVFFFDDDNYYEYRNFSEPTWYSPLSSSNVQSSVSKSSGLQGYGGTLGPFYLVIDNTDYAEAKPPSSNTTLRADITVEVYPDGMGPRPSVGEINVELVSDQPGESDGAEWKVVVKLASDVSGETLRVYDCPDYEQSDCELNEDYLIFRRSLHDTDGVEQFQFKPDDTLPHFRGGDYVFVVERDGEITARSVYQVDRSLSVTAPRFESFANDIVVNGYAADKTFQEGNVGFSFLVTNTGSAPIWIRNLGVTGDIEYKGGNGTRGGFWIDDPVSSGYETLNIYELHPEESVRFGAFGFNLPSIENVDTICSGEERIANLHVVTSSGFRTVHKVAYSVDEPAEEVSFSGERRYVCLSGTIAGLEQVKAGYE